MGLPPAAGARAVRATGPRGARRRGPRRLRAGAARAGDEPPADDLREQNLQSWDAAAAAWGRQAERWEAIARPVTERLLELAELGPGDVVLELGAGAGETGRRAAERVAPDGHVLVTDPAPGMA